MDIQGISTAKKLDNLLSDSLKSILHGYAEGLNYYAALHWDQVLVPELFPVTNVDVMTATLFKLPIFVRLLQQLEKLGEDDPYYFVSMGGRPTGNVTRDPTEKHVEENTQDERMGSNAWAINGKRSVNNETYLNINSHLPWTGIIAWYETHVHSEEGWNAYGGTFPALPLVMLGFNEHLGWAHTVNRPDVLDTFLLELDPSDPDRFYKFDNRSVPFEITEVVIKVKLFDIKLPFFTRSFPIFYNAHQKIYRSVHGPVLRMPHGSYAFKTGDWDNMPKVLEQWLALNKATNFDEWKAGLAQQHVPIFNSVYADKTGILYFAYSAKFPSDRNPNYLYNLILDGSSSKPLWSDKEFLPFDQLPQILNPRSGFIQNCNNSPFNLTVLDADEIPDPNRYVPGFPIERTMTNRAQRIFDIVSQHEQISWEMFKEHKWDMYYAPSSNIARFCNITTSTIRTILKEKQVFEFPEWLRSANLTHVEQGLSLVENWDLQVNPESTAAALVILSFAPYLRYYELDDVQMIRAISDDPTPYIRSFVKTIDRLIVHYGRLDVRYDTVNRIVRGNKNLGLGGGPDIVHSVKGEIMDDKKWIKGNFGDALVLVIKWDSNQKLASVEGLHQFGSATSRPESPHYDDQVELLVNRQYRTVYFFEEDIRANLEEEYVAGKEKALPPVRHTLFLSRFRSDRQLSATYFYVLSSFALLFIVFYFVRSFTSGESETQTTKPKTD